SRIAAANGTSVEELTQLNQLASSHLKIGQLLRITGSPDANRSLALNSDSKATSYRVKAGDSLWNIARSHNVKVDDLISWNNLKRDAVLSPGQQLTLRGGSTSSNSNTAAINYQVKQGDSLYEIARRFKV